MSREFFRSAISDFGVHISFRDEKPKDWSYVYDSLSFHSFMGSDIYITYQKAYFEECCDDDLSIVLYNKNSEPCGILPLHVGKVEGAPLLSTGGMPIEPIQFSNDTSIAEQKRISKSVLQGLMAYAVSSDHCDFNCRAHLDNLTGTISPWHASCADLATSSAVDYQAYIDLTNSLDDIWSNFRKSYKPLVNKAHKIWSSEVLEHDLICKKDWEDFKTLHFQAAGNRKTRKKESWDIQFSQIKEGNAFLILLRDNNSILVGGGYFQYTRDQGIYSVGAYDRSKFDKPIGHLVQWLAIQKLKKLGVKSYIIGHRPYRSDLVNSTDKEMNIGIFKDGFSNKVWPRFTYKFTDII